jgi:hypothetical protein
MISPENKLASQYAQADASATGDWLRLTVMLLLLIVARLVAPMSHAKPLTNAAPEKPPIRNISFFLTGSKQ